jgi:predicted N-formylglutamate amidohydrolase
LAGVPRTRGEGEVVDPVVVENRAGASPFVILCDHGSNFIPREHAGLGLDAEAREAHIAWDPGALGVARHLARDLDAALVFCTVSRLVIDCNRRLDAPDLIATTSETTAIPGNAALSDVERRRRIASVHAPYHAAIEGLLDERQDRGRATSLIAVHSFTPVYRGVRRPWPVSIIFDRDRRLADVLIRGLASSGLNVGVNEPYSPADRVYYTLSRHGESRGLECVMIEIRNDRVRSNRETAAWADRIAALLSGTSHASRGNVGSAAGVG